MTEEVDLRDLSSEELHARIERLDAIWNIWDRKSDPKGEYTRRQNEISSEIEEIRTILRDRS